MTMLARNLNDVSMADVAAVLLQVYPNSRFKTFRNNKRKLSGPLGELRCFDRKAGRWVFHCVEVHTVADVMREVIASADLWRTIATPATGAGR